MGLLEKLKGMFGKKAEQTQNEMPSQMEAPVQTTVGQMGDLLQDRPNVAPTAEPPVIATPVTPVESESKDNVSPPPTNLPQ